MRATEEICCDDLVISSLNPAPRTYADSLLQAIEYLAAPVIRRPMMASEITEEEGRARLQGMQKRMAGTEAEVETTKNGKVYDLKGSAEGKAYEIEITANGKIMEVEVDDDDDDDDGDDD